jgi:hypothetical protein
VSWSDLIETPEPGDVQRMHETLAARIWPTAPPTTAIAMPRHLTPAMISAVRDADSTRIEDRDEWHERLGWLICAWDVLVAECAKATEVQP